MTTQTKIYNFFNRQINASNESLFLPNEYCPPKGLDGLKIEKTVTPKDKATLNEVFENTLNR